MGNSTTKLLAIAFLLIPSLVYGAAIQGKEEGSVVGYCKSIDFVGAAQTLTASGLDCTLTNTAEGGAGTGDVDSVGDCASGACLDGTSDGGTWIKFYDAQGAGQLITGDLTEARVWTLPNATGTVALTSGLHAAVTLSVAADTLLDLSTQEIGLNTQTANLVFAGPASGAAATPTFRTLVDDDINWATTTDLAAGGAVVWANLAEGELADSTVVSEDIKDGTITTSDLATATITPSVCFIIDGGGSAITTGAKAWVRASTAFTIGGVEITADQSGSCVVDIWKDTYANFPPTNDDSITASAPPTLSTAQKNQDTTLTGWTKTVSVGDYLRANVDSCSTVEMVEVCIYE